MQTLIELGIIFLAVVLSVWPGIYLISWLLSLALRSSGRVVPERPMKLRGKERRSETVEVEPEVLRGGAWIGALERIAVTLSILFGQYAVVAVVVAVKGLGRFSELKTSYASEKFVIGTLASLIWAALIGVFAVWALSAIRG